MPSPLFQKNVQFLSSALTASQNVGPGVLATIRIHGASALRAILKPPNWQTVHATVAPMFVGKNNLPERVKVDLARFVRASSVFPACIFLMGLMELTKPVTRKKMQTAARPPTQRRMMGSWKSKGRPS